MGFYSINIEVFLLNYPSVKRPGIISFEVIYCQVLSITTPVLQDQTYNIQSVALSIIIPQFTQIPNCGYAFEYSVQIKDPNTAQYSPLPPFIIFNQNALDLTVFSTESSDSGEYLISVKANIPLQFDPTQQIVEATFKINVINLCLQDEITVL